MKFDHFSWHWIKVFQDCIILKKDSFFLSFESKKELLDQVTNYANEILVASILDEMQLDPVLPTICAFL